MKTNRVSLLLSFSSVSFRVDFTEQIGWLNARSHLLAIDEFEKVDWHDLWDYKLQKICDNFLRFVGTNQFVSSRRVKHLD